MRIRSALLACVLCFPFTGFADGEWPEFRGPRGDGTSPAQGTPLEFGENKNLVWKTAIHGRGWSSPVVWDDQVWLTTATEDGKEMSAVCVDFATGEIAHDVVLFRPEKVYYRHPTNSYASPTAALEEGRGYFHFGRYGTACLDTRTGEVIWKRTDLESEDFRGPGSSPIIVGDKLFVAYDGIDVQFVVAFDKKTGKTAWRKDRNIDYGTTNPDRMKAYSTARVIEHNGRRQLISPSAAATIAYDPDTGEELWRIHHGGMNAAARPLYGHGLVYLSAGSGTTSLIAVRPDGTGKLDEKAIVWNTNQATPNRPSQILLDDLFFYVNDSGVVSCVEAKTGKPVWRKRLGGEHWASPVYADGKLYLSTKEGDYPVIAASREFKVLAQNKLETGGNASPAIVGKSLIIRTATHLYRFEERE